jgi:hypothetical protein
MLAEGQSVRVPRNRRINTMATKTKSKKSNGKTAKPRENKSAKIVAMLKRPSGVTRKAVLAATGWKAVSMQQMASNAGLTLKMEKPDGKPIVYRA